MEKRKKENRNTNTRKKEVKKTNLRLKKRFYGWIRKVT